MPGVCQTVCQALENQRSFRPSPCYLVLCGGEMAADAYGHTTQKQGLYEAWTVKSKEPLPLSECSGRLSQMASLDPASIFATYQGPLYIKHLQWLFKTTPQHLKSILNTLCDLSVFFDIIVITS